MARLENASATPVLLDVELARLLPRLVLEAQEDHLGTDGVLDTLERSRLVFGAGAGGTVAATSMGPARLQHVDVLARADTVQDIDFGLDEGAGLVGSDARVEERVQVGANDINDGAEFGSRAGVLPDGQRLGQADQTRVSSTLESGRTASNEASELRCGAVSVEHSLISDHDQLNQIPLCPANNVGDLSLCARDASGGDPNAENQLESVGTGSTANVLEGAAVSAVDTNRSESLFRNDGEICRNSAGILATTGRRVW